MKSYETIGAGNEMSWHVSKYILEKSPWTYFTTRINMQYICTSLNVIIKLQNSIKMSQDVSYQMASIGNDKTSIKDNKKLKLNNSFAIATLWYPFPNIIVPQENHDSPGIEDMICLSVAKQPLPFISASVNRALLFCLLLFYYCIFAIHFKCWFI